MCSVGWFKVLNTLLVWQSLIASYDRMHYMLVYMFIFRYTFICQMFCYCIAESNVL